MHFANSTGSRVAFFSKRYTLPPLCATITAFMERMNLMKRTKLRDRVLPSYCKGEEIMNMVTHIVGGGIGVLALALCTVKAAMSGDSLTILGSGIYGLCMVALYAMSSVYHGLRPGMAKRVMQVLDHCTIYFLIAGTYTVIALSGLRRLSPTLCWTVLGIEWGLTAIAVTLTAIDLKKYNVFSMICYIGMGWCVAFFLPQTIQALGNNGFLWLLAGGIAYTLGAVLYGIGSKKPWFHSVFHIFVVLGSLLQLIAIFVFAL